MRPLIAFFTAIVTALSLSSCSPSDGKLASSAPPPPEPTPFARKQAQAVPSHVHGVVTNTQTGEAVAEATVTLHEGSADRHGVFSTRTARDGRYNFDDVQVGSYRVDFTAAKFYSSLGSVVTVHLIDDVTKNVALTPLPTPTPTPPPPVPTATPIPPGVLDGQIKNAKDGRGLSGVTVTVHPQGSSVVIATATTDYAGYYSIGGLVAGSISVDYILTGFIPIKAVALSIFSGQTTNHNESLTPGLLPGQTRIVMTWCGPPATPEYPETTVRDVDSYLLLRPYQEIGYENMNPGWGANLDVDNMRWSGPETITITEQRQGEYIYYVNNYNNRSNLTALGNSSVLVRLYKGDPDGGHIVKTYNVPPGVGNTFELFHLNGDQVIDTMKYNDSLPHY